jgi:hypothetical protein
VGRFVADLDLLALALVRLALVLLKGRAVRPEQRTSTSSPDSSHWLSSCSATASEPSPVRNSIMSWRSLAADCSVTWRRRSRWKPCSISSRTGLGTRMKVSTVPMQSNMGISPEN